MMRLFLLFIIAVMTISLFADEVKPVEIKPETTAPVEKEVKADKEKLPDITIIPGDGMNLVIEDILNPHYVVVKLNSPAHNWFAGQFKNLPTDKETAIGLSMDDNDTTGNKADVSKWKGLMPVMTYGDPTKYETYEWYTKNDKGRWVSGDPFKKGDDKYAGTGKVPEQTAISIEVAEDFLSKDGNYWQPWREVDSAEALPNLNIFRIKQKFKLDTATVCMRVPYTYTYQQEFIKRLKEAKVPGVFVDEIGTTPEKRKLQVIRLQCMKSDNSILSCHPTILVYAREHGTEHDSSHALVGMLNWLLSNVPDAIKEKTNTNFIYIPILDVDSSVNSAFDNGDYFAAVEPIKSEAITYATYLINWIDSGQRIDIVINLHNVECNENGNISSPLVNRSHMDAVRKFNEMLFKDVVKNGYTADDPQGWESGIMGKRLYGWCYRRFSSFDIALEINTRSPQNRLSLNNTYCLGKLVIQHVIQYINKEDFFPVSLKITDFLTERIKKRETWWKQEGHDKKHRSLYDLFTCGY